VVDNYEGLQPKIRPDISFSIGEVKGDRTVYYVNDRFTDQFYRIGEKEHFLLRRMDGHATLADIGRDYEARFGKHLSEHSWEGLFKLLDERQMLEGKADEERLKELRAQAKENRRKEGQRLFYRRFHLINPDALLTRMLPWVRFMFHPTVVLSGVAAIIAVEIWTLLNYSSLSGMAWEGGHPRSWIVFIGLMLLFALFHEMGHGLACKYFGGVVNEMGIMWRYIYLFPYCKLDHIILFHKRRHRVYVAAAGIYIGLLLLVPFAVIWLLAEPHSLAAVISAKILLLYNFMTLLNFIPFVQLDGYFMLSHALGMAELRQEAHSFLLKAVKHSLLGKGEGVGSYRKRERRIYGIYGTLSLLMTASVIVFMVTFWYRMAISRFGGEHAWAVLGGIILLLALRRAGFGWMKTLYHRWRPATENTDPVISTTAKTS
jgi:putative peptide zinc metalloprotease protein